jgi:class 3 adenylate cyclase
MTVTLKSDLETYVKSTFESVWTKRDGQVVPDDPSVKLANDAVKLDATVLYADLSASTDLVDRYLPSFAAEIYKTYLYCAAKIIVSEGGTISAYDGDRVMAIFIGKSKNTSAIRTALKINWAVKNLIMPAKSRQYPKSTYDLKQVIGIDTSPLYVAKTGIRGANDLVWVGKAANYAAKLCALPDTDPTYITDRVFQNCAEEARLSQGKSMWEAVTWTPMNNARIYRSTYWWSFS